MIVFDLQLENIIQCSIILGFFFFFSFLNTMKDLRDVKLFYHL